MFSYVENRKRRENFCGLGEADAKVADGKLIKAL